MILLFENYNNSEQYFFGLMQISQKLLVKLYFPVTE